MGACMYGCMRNLLEGGRTASLSYVRACMDACVTCLRERTASLSCVSVCMDACITCLREGELPAFHMCVRVWLCALPA